MKSIKLTKKGENYMSEEKIQLDCWECGCTHSIDEICPICGETGGTIVNTNQRVMPNHILESMDFFIQANQNLTAK